MCVLSHVQLFEIPWTIACQASPSMGPSRQEYWNGLPFSPPGELLNPGIKPTSPVTLAYAGRFFATEPPLTLCDPMNCNTPGFPLLYYLPEFAQTHVHQVSDATQPSHPLSPPSLHALSLSHHQGLFKRISSSNQLARLLELQHQSFL